MSLVEYQKSKRNNNDYLSNSHKKNHRVISETRNSNENGQYKKLRDTDGDGQRANNDIIYNIM